MDTCYPQVSYLRQEQRGVSAARNLGARRAAGRWLAFLDSDDEWLPNKLQRQLGALRREPNYRVCHSDEIWIRRGRRVNPMKKHQKYGGWIFDRCLARCVISPSSAVIDRSLFFDLGGFDESLPACEDYDLWLRLCSKHRVLFVPDKLLRKYGGHADQLSRAHWGMDRFRIRALQKLLQQGRLGPTDYRRAVTELVRKLDILCTGAKKRENLASWRQLSGLRDEWAARLRNGLADPSVEGGKCRQIT